jgi:hypothetical protein
LARLLICPYGRGLDADYAAILGRISREASVVVDEN